MVYVLSLFANGSPFYNRNVKHRRAPLSREHCRRGLPERRFVRAARRPLLILKKPRPAAPPPPPPPARVGSSDGARRVNTGGQRRNLPIVAGTVLQGRYRITSTLGMGGMSTVYKALDLRFANVERACAVKEMFDP